MPGMGGGTVSGRGGTAAPGRRSVTCHLESADGAIS
jgi:hypothetical protein